MCATSRLLGGRIVTDYSIESILDYPLVLQTGLKSDSEAPGIPPSLRYRFFVPKPIKIDIIEKSAQSVNRINRPNRKIDLIEQSVNRIIDSIEKSVNRSIPCGAGESRTRVRTKRHNAFYMLSPGLDFRVQAWFRDRHNCTLSSKFQPTVKASRQPISLFL